MEYERALQIVRSRERVEVLHGKRPVWIHSLDPAKRTADVFADGENYTVPVEELVEADPGLGTE